MRRIILAMLVASSGCATASATVQLPGQPTRTIDLHSPGIEVRVFNRCAGTRGYLYPPGKGDPIVVGTEKPVILPVEEGWFKVRGDRHVNFVYIAYRGSTMLATVSHTFDIQDNFTQYDWIIGGEYQGGGSNITYNSLPQGKC